MTKEKQRPPRAQRLYDAVRAAGGQAAVARRSVIPLATLSRYLIDREMRVPELLALSEACGVSIEWLATGRGERDASPFVHPAAQLPGIADEFEQFAASFGGVAAKLSGANAASAAAMAETWRMAAAILRARAELTDPAAAQP